ncbi:MAG: prepilin-type N-terminal cleavage/methylation domain-containing protein [FCB group bacterium]|jgi:prepilin-type N-terminal cleavage/methylation domain-containing protein|nr:prepilin-type N-terminal cleavage/methylation domain-containing protein [FCB group bacterium]
MSKPRARGFTLIELLTVIAIIAILVGITAAVLPGVMERAKITKTETTFKQLHTALSTYQIDRGSLPAGYGYYLHFNEDTGKNIYQYQPYTVAIKSFRDFALYDEYWAQDYDLSKNNHIDMLEFQPLGKKTPGGNYVFYDPADTPSVYPALYTGSNLSTDTEAMKTATPPFAYFPVNRAQADKLRKFCASNPSYEFANTSEVATFIFNNLSFPPPFYDDYVLVSPGPAGKTFGVIVEDDNKLMDTVTDTDGDGDDLGHTYYINALRTFYLATRDQNENGLLDYDFRARTRGGENFTLPDGSMGAGPLIFHAGK